MGMRPTTCFAMLVALSPNWVGAQETCGGFEARSLGAEESVLGDRLRMRFLAGGGSQQRPFGPFPLLGSSVEVQTGAWSRRFAYEGEHTFAVTATEVYRVVSRHAELDVRSALPNTTVRAFRSDHGLEIVEVVEEPFVVVGGVTRVLSAYIVSPDRTLQHLAFFSDAPRPDGCRALARRIVRTVGPGRARSIARIGEQPLSDGVSITLLAPHAIVEAAPHMHTIHHLGRIGGPEAIIDITFASFALRDTDPAEAEFDGTLFGRHVTWRRRRTAGHGVYSTVVALPGEERRFMEITIVASADALAREEIRALESMRRR
jgi:hypothetical protein